MIPMLPRCEGRWRRTKTCVWCMKLGKDCVGATRGLGCAESEMHGGGPQLHRMVQQLTNGGTLFREETHRVPRRARNRWNTSRSSKWSNGELETDPIGLLDD